MYWLARISLLIAAGLIQVSIVPAIEICNVRPDLPLLAALAIVLHRRKAGEWRWTAFWIGWAGGLISDLFSIGSALPVGSSAFIYGIVCFSVGQLEGEMLVKSLFARAIIAAPICIAATVPLALAHAYLTTSPLGEAVASGIYSSIYSAVAAPFVIALVVPFARPAGVQSLSERKKDA